METNEYIIRGGAEGRERLRILARVMQPTTLALLRRAGIAPGMTCWEVGSGGGDVARDMAQMVGPQGRVVATDIDRTKLAIAAEENKAIANLEFRYADIMADDMAEQFDFIHARFVLSHLPDPAAALARMRRALKPGGLLALEDTDFAGHFTWPPLPALRRFAELYTAAAARRGADACIGPRLPSLLSQAGFETLGMNIVQPCGITGDVKLITPITMEFIGPAVLDAKLATQDEIDRLAGELHAHARKEETIGALARIFEVWGR